MSYMLVQKPFSFSMPDVWLLSIRTKGFMPSCVASMVAMASASPSMVMAELTVSGWLMTYCPIEARRSLM